MRTAIKKIQVLKLSDVKKTIISELLCALFGFLLSRTVVFGSFMPFGYAFVSSLSIYQVFSGLFGCILGSISPANSGFSAYYIGLCVLAAAIKFISLNIYEKKNSLFFSLFTCLVCSAFGAVSLFVSVKLNMQYYIRITGESLLSLSATYFFNSALPVLNTSKPLSRMSSIKICSVIMSVSIILMSLNDYTILFASPARIFAVLIILLSARFGSVNTAAVCAVSLGFAMSFTSDNLFFLIGAYAFGGMLAGVAGRTGKIFCILGFFLGATCVLIGFFKNSSLSVVYTEFFVGSMLFLAIPKSFDKVFLDMFLPPPSLPRIDSMRKNIVQRLKFASNAMHEVSRNVNEIGQKLDKRGKVSVCDLFAQMQKECCADCGLNFHCYAHRKKETYEAFFEMTKTFKKNGFLTDNVMPPSLKKRCLKPNEVTNALCKKYKKYDIAACENERVTQIRNVISSQVDGLSDMLYDLAVEFNETQRFDTETASRVDTLLRSIGIASTDVACKYDNERNLSVEIIAKRQKNSVPKLELVNRLSQLCAVKFDTPCITNGTDITMINLAEKKNYKVNFGVCQINCKGQKVSGDTYTCFSDGKGKYVMILSDGMGCGASAAIDSSFAANLMEKLIKAGFGFECALKMVNSAMIFKSGEETTATLDIATIDLYSGQVDIYKAGASQTYVVKGKKIGIASCNAYPTGILENIKFDKSSTTLQKGDVLVMCSDGVLEEDEPWIEEEILNCRKSSAQGIADKIATLAKIRRENKYPDDITVMAAVVDEEY